MLTKRVFSILVFSLVFFAFSGHAHCTVKKSVAYVETGSEPREAIDFNLEAFLASMIFLAFNDSFTYFEEFQLPLHFDTNLPKHFNHDIYFSSDSSPPIES